jgi:1,2-phenylacetyl-CoA epoxidase PaaB subunit
VPAFRVEFFKEVTGDRGQDPCRHQGAFDVDAPDRESAAVAAKDLFCSARRIQDWSINADRYRIGPLRKPLTRRPADEGR